MRADVSRPTAVAVMGWGAIVVGILMLLSGGMAALGSTLLPSEPPSSPSRHPEAVDLVFRNFLCFGIAQMVLGVVVGLAGRALLALRKWGALVVQVFAALLLLYAVVFTAYIALDMRRAFGHSESPPTAFVVMMTVMVVVTLAFWATPTALTIYHLRKLNAAGLWRNAGSRRTRG